MESSKKTIYINLKPSRRNEQRFKAQFPMAICMGYATLRGSSRSYALPEDIYFANTEEVKNTGQNHETNKARYGK